MPSTYIIAEIGVNHNGDIDVAKKLIHAAKNSGSNAVKVQIFKANNVVNKNTELAVYQQREGLKNQHDLLRKLELNHADFIELQKECKKISIDFLASTFDSESMEFAVNELALNYLKIASGELLNAQHLYAAGASGLPIILSTGMASIGEVERALSYICYGILGILPNKTLKSTEILALKENWMKVQSRVKLMHCSSNYPANFSQLNLRAIQTLKNSFGLEVGYSDHTSGSVASVVAVALGANLIEKHITLDKRSNGPDHAASLNVEEFTQLVSDIRNTELTFGEYRKIPSLEELGTRKVVTRTLFSAIDLSRGDSISTDSMIPIRSQSGIDAEYFFEILGRTLAKDIKKGTPINWGDLK